MAEAINIQNRGIIVISEIVEGHELRINQIADDMNNGLHFLGQHNERLY